MTNTIKLAQEWLQSADAILVTASNGFSITEGLNLFAQDDNKLQVVLGDLVDKYHLTSLIMAFNYDYPNQLDRWRAYARLAEFYIFNYQPGELMTKLHHLIDNKPNFIWTSNGEHHFAMADFDHYLEIEGNWQTGVCSAHPKDHPVVNLRTKLHQIYLKDQAGTLSENDLPTCKTCGAPLTLNTPGPNFQMDQQQVQAFQDFIEQYQDKKLVVLELGIGPQNQLIKAPSMQLVAANPHSHYISINQGQLNIPNVISDRSIGFSATIMDAIDALIKGKGNLETQGPCPTAPNPSAEEQEQQAAILKQFYPSYIVNRGLRPGELVMYLTVDNNHPSHLHMVKYGRPIMYSFGDAVKVHCFTPDGQYQLVKLGLNKKKGEMHGFYANAGTFLAMEHDKGPTGFSQISINLPESADGEIMVPKISELKKVFPTQQKLIDRLAIKEE